MTLAASGVRLQGLTRVGVMFNAVKQCNKKPANPKDSATHIYKSVYGKEPETRKGNAIWKLKTFPGNEEVMGRCPLFAV